MGYEVDFLKVGDGEKGGDAIAVRFGDLHGPRDQQLVMVIDGGTKESGQALVEHLWDYYGTATVDLAVSTHPDGDHVSGLHVVVEQLNVNCLFMHRPWLHADALCSYFPDSRITPKGLATYFRKSLAQASELEGLAMDRGVPIVEPFAGEPHPFLDIGIEILGPTRDYYEYLLPSFRDTPASPTKEGVLRRFAEAVKNVLEGWDVETLEEPPDDATSAENNSSVVLLLSTDGRRLLFTGDTGVSALTRAVERAEGLGVYLPSLRFVQVPHHGSRRNVGPTILNRILGPIHPVGANGKTAFVSVPTRGEPKHPSRRVTNAFIRRGATVVATAGSSKRHSHDAPERPEWVPAEPIPFYDEVEE